MKVSFSWCQDNSSVDLLAVGKDALIDKIGAQLGAVDEVIEWATRYNGIVVAKVLSCTKHPDADKLSLCTVDDGGTTKDVARNDDGSIQVVCGAPNVETGQLIAYIPPGVVVPSTLAKDPLTLESREIRGQMSNGMIASAHELGISSDHTGILVITGEDVGEENTKLGTEFKKLYGLDDTVVDIENKMFTHRPDCFGMLGVARELAGIQGLAFKSPDWYKESVDLGTSNQGVKIDVQNEIPQLVPRFIVVPLSDTSIAPSPIHIQASLSRVGIKPINNVVDITNFVMMLTGQPLHAYDADKLTTGKMGVRLSRAGEALTLLGGKEIKLQEGSPVITNGEKPIGLAGVMGGADTEVDEATKNIILECGSFDMNATRRSSMAYGLFTDASTRFTKGQSPRQNAAAVGMAVQLLQQIGGVRLAGEVVDVKARLPEPTHVKVSALFINERLGLNLSTTEMSDLLQNVEFEVSQDAENLSIISPFWRTDIEIPEDIVEEIGRLYGYDNLPKELPTRDISPASPDDLLGFKDKIREALVSAGSNELLTYSFVHGSLLEKVGQPVEQAYKIKNALSPDLQYYRLSLMPSLLEKVHPNIKLGYGRFIAFELGKSHNKLHPEDGDEKVPMEFNMLALVSAATDKSTPDSSGAAFFQAKHYLDFLGSKLGIHFNYEPLSEAPDYPVAKPYDFSRSAAVSIAETGTGIGMIGEFRAEVIRGLKLPKYAAGFEIGVKELLSGIPSGTGYKPLSRFPKIEQDITLQVDASHNYGETSKLLEKTLSELKPKDTRLTLTPLDIYQSELGNKRISLRLVITSHDRTLIAGEVNDLLDSAASVLKDKIGAQRV